MSTPEHVLKFFAQFIEAQLGIIYVEANYFQLEHRLRDIATQLGYADVSALHREAQQGITGMMRSLLLDLATNNETSFFRDGTVFAALSKHIVPELCAQGLRSSVRIWSAASSSGQEAYSIAMEFAEARRLDPRIPALEMLVSDVSDTILKRAQAGLYSQLEIQRGLPAKLLVQYFEKREGDHWQVRPELQRGLSFRKLNLLEDWGAIGSFDVVFMRNVLIYQSVENKKKVIALVHQRLNPGGYLILGAAESLFGISDQFDQISAERAVVYRRK